MRLGGRSVLFEVVKRLLPLQGIEPWFLGCSVHNLATVLVTLCQLPTKAKGKAIPLQAWTGPEDSRRLRLPVFKTVGT
jgi:hypothetical protein